LSKKKCDAMKKWTRGNIPTDLSDKTYVITRTSSGIGTVLAYELAKRGAHIITGNRNVDKARKALQDIQNPADDLSRLTILPLDISSLQSVRDFAEMVNADPNISHINGLLLNAGIMALPERKESVDGFELQMATNVLGHHLLTSLLIEKIKQAPSSVIISTTSSASGTVSDKKIWDDLNAEKKYDAWEVYGLSKIAAVQFRDGLREILKKAKLDDKIKVISTHPGLTATPLFDVGKGFISNLFRSVKGIFMMTPVQGALSSLRAVLDDSIPSGSFIGPDGITGFNGNPKIIKEYNRKLALDPVLRKKMWDYCDQATNASWKM
jgi:NAD(P)-dependent dehydrogenase (short-subunit alcohol dehydrogenase family)